MDEGVGESVCIGWSCTVGNDLGVDSGVMVGSDCGSVTGLESV